MSYHINVSGHGVLPAPLREIFTRLVRELDEATPGEPNATGTIAGGDWTGDDSAQAHEFAMTAADARLSWPPGPGPAR
jgi:hypothetical protein